MRDFIITSILLGFDKITLFFEGWSLFRISNSRLTLGMTFKLYTSVAKGLKLKVRKFLGLIPTFSEVTGEQLIGDGSLSLAPAHLSILNRVNRFMCNKIKN